MENVSKCLSLAVLISGGGTTLKNLIDRIADGTLKAEIKVVLSSREGVRGIEFAEEANIPTFVVPRKKCKSTEEFSEKVTDILRKFNPDLIVFGGFLSLYLFPEEFRGRIINIHPALLPSFGGKGMYGDHVHEAVLKSGAKVSGCSVHFVDEIYDHGPIIAQRVVPVLPDDTVDSLRERVQRVERELYPEVINWFAEGRVRLGEDGKARIEPRKSWKSAEAPLEDDAR